MLSIGNQFDAKEFRDALTLVQHKLDSALEDPVYRGYVLAVQRQLPLPTVSEEYHGLADAARLVGNTYEKLGILVKNGIIDRNIFLESLFLGYRTGVESHKPWACVDPCHHRQQRHLGKF